MATNVAICPSITGGLIGKSEKKHRLKQRFEVIRKLGQGTYGKVQLAINKETRQEVAIKTIKKSKIENEKDLIRIRREIQIMSSIQHPNIIHIFDVFENKDKIVLVMQFARGGELYEYVSERKKLTDNEARRIFRQIATAIYYCHKNKVCHRDLKLENILLDDKGNAKIGDFGLSNVFDLRNTLNTFCGSALYASPEIVKGTPYFGPEVDCWSLGVLLYTLVYGAMPFDDGSNYKSLVKLISEAKYFEPKQKSDASNLIRKLLCVQPSKRATIIDICTDAWVNKDCERCLLQVAEDLANLTPVKIEVLLALAPIPQSDDQTSIEAEKKSTDEEPKVSIVEPDEQSVKRRKSTKKSIDGKKSKDKENESKSKASKTKDDNNNLDAEKLKIKSSQQSKNSLNQDSDYMSEEPISLSKKSESGSRSTINQSIGDLNDKQTTVKNEVTRKSSVKTQRQVSNTAVPATGNNDKSKEQSKEPIKKAEEVINSSISLMRKSSTKAKSAASKSPAAAVSTSITNKENNKDVKETIKETTKDASKDNLKESVLKGGKEPASTGKKSLVTQQSIESEKTEDDQVKEPIVVRTQSKIGDAKRIFEKPRRQESIEREKQERIILLNKVSDVKNKFERRASVNAANAQLWKTNSERKKSIADGDQAAKPSVMALTPLQKPANEQLVKDNLSKVISPNQITTSPISSSATLKDETIKPITTTTSISTIKPKLVERQVSVSSSTNNPPTGNDRSNLKVRRHTVKAKTSSTTAVPTIAELKRKELFAIKEKPNGVETIKENEIVDQVGSTKQATSPTTKTSQSLNTEPFLPRSTPPPAPTPSTQPMRQPTSVENQSAKQSTSSNAPQVTSTIDRPKLKILNTTTSPPTSSSKLFNSSGNALNCNQSASFIVQSPSIKSINSQDSLSGSTSTNKLAPIARSYKKISFTKDGATITETGKIISEETPSGTKITKKIISKKSTPHDRLSSRNQFDSETDDYTSSTLNDRAKSRPGLMNANSNSSNLSSNISSSNIRKSDSTSSSGSVDIFDDIFDTWVGDNPMFNNISGKFKSMFNQPNSSSLFGNSSFGRSKANFPSFLNRSKPSLSKSRAESCERKHNDENPMSPNVGLLRRPGYSTEGESDTDNEEINGQNGLWKFLNNPNIATRLLNKHPSLMNGMDFFNSPDSCLTNRSRDRLKFDSKPPAFISNRFKSASRDLVTDPNDTVFKTTFTIKPNGSTKIVTTTSRNNSATNLAPGSSVPQVYLKNNLINPTPLNRFVERMNEQPIDYNGPNQQAFDLEPELGSDFKANFPLTINRIRSQNSPIVSPQIHSPFNTPRSFNRSTSARLENNPHSFMDTSNYRGLNMKVHDIPIEQEASSIQQKEHRIPIVRQSSVEQQENSLLDQLRTHGYRSLVNQRNSKLNNFGVSTPINPASSADEQSTGVANNKRGKRSNDLKNANESVHVLTNDSRLCKSLITNTQEIDSLHKSNCSLTNSLNHLNDHQVTTNHFVSDYHSSKHSSKTNKQLTVSTTNRTTDDKKFDYKGLVNVAREMNCLVELNNTSRGTKTNRLTEKYSSLSSKSLEHLNSIDLTKPSLFKHICLSTKTHPNQQQEATDRQLYDASDEEGDLKRLSDQCSDERSAQKMRAKPIPKARKTKSIQNKIDRSNDEDDTTMDESTITLSSTDSVCKGSLTRDHQLAKDELSDLKDDYLNCSINNQVNQIQQLIQLLYAENEDECNEKSKSKTGPGDNKFKEDNYQLLRKTQSDLRELKNDLQILQLKNKLKRRLVVEPRASILAENNFKESDNSQTSTETSNTVTPTSDEEESIERRHKKSMLNNQSLPPLPPHRCTLFGSAANRSSNNVRSSEYKYSLSDRLNDNLMINQSNQRMMDNVNCCLTSNSYAQFNDQNTVPHSLINSQHELSTNKHIFSSNTKQNASFSSTRSSSSLNGYHQSAFTQPSTANKSSANSSELTRRSTIGSSSTETVQERILRKSFYSRFQSPDRQSLDNQRQRRRLSSSSYLNVEPDDFQNETRRLSRKSHSKSSLMNDEENSSTPLNRPSTNTYTRRTSPYRSIHSDDLSDEDLVKSLSSINRRNSFAYGSSNRFPSLNASFERKLDDNQAAIKSSESKRNSVAFIDYDNNNNLFRNGLNSLRPKMNDGLHRVASNSSDLSCLNNDQSDEQSNRRNLKKIADKNSKRYGFNFYNLELST